MSAACLRSPEQDANLFRLPREKRSKERRCFSRLGEKGVFHRLGDKENGMSAYSGSSKRQSYHSSAEDTANCYFRGGHWKSKSKKQRSSVEDEDLSQPWVCEETDLFTPRIRYFDLPKRIRMPSHVKTYDGSEDPEDHLKIFQAAACILGKLPPAKEVIKTPSKSINKAEGPRGVFKSTKDFVWRYPKIESRDVKGAPEVMRILGFMHGITNPELIKCLHDKISNT
ncbi:hypothetical protein Tco_1067030 [Tanacetum coccineum]|uniref:Reverse transcriptase domain-containing protein n=1 Tax=Tanacetum coccineum TaxID=301880 RepID=A0ABQ5HDV7_9ASTR